ncbi:MAG: DUF6503 family protein, partial [Chthoniobacterales bacterium]
AALSCLATSAFGGIGATLDAHGGLEKWRGFAGVEYDLMWKSAKGARHDHELFNLQTRDGLITSDKYTLGRDGGKVWIKPGLDALGGTPPRFYMGTPFYFFGMPFVFADPGSKQKSLGTKSFRGHDYDVLKITFAKGTGDTPDDFYLAYVDPDSEQLKLAIYVVTYPAMRKGKALDQLEKHAIVFDEWQTVDGLLVPKKAQFYKWTGTDLEGKVLGALEYSNVHFLQTSPDESKFRRPEGAVVAPLTGS